MSNNNKNICIPNLFINEVIKNIKIKQGELLKKKKIKDDKGKP